MYLAYKESGIDSIAEFIGARSSLFSQVYYHKTNRAFATMLSTLCEIMQSKDPQNVIIADVTDRIVDHSDESFIDALKEFYLSCSDDYFLNDKVGEWIDISDTEAVNKKYLMTLLTDTHGRRSMRPNTLCIKLTSLTRKIRRGRVNSPGY